MVRRVPPRDHIRAVRLDRMRDLRSGVSIAANELSRRAKSQIQNVMQDQHLTIAARTCADSNRWGGNFGGNHLSNFPWDAFQKNACHACSVERRRISHELFDI